MISKERVVADNEIFSIPYRILKSENVFLVKMRPMLTRIISSYVKDRTEAFDDYYPCRRKQLIVI